MDWRRWAAGLVVFTLAGCSSQVVPTSNEEPADIVSSLTPLRVEVLERYPHDTDAFTQGLELHDGILYESTGLYGESDVRTVDPATGQVQLREPLDDEFFGEGLTAVDDQLWQLTWQEGTAIRYDRGTLAELARVSYEGEGWGLCYDLPRDRLVMSDGSDTLTFRDPESFEETGSVQITRAGQPQLMINELECVDDRVWANIWLTDEIVRIDPAQGVVDALVDAADLLTESERAAADVLNGIAVLPDGETFYLTGKFWPWLFEARFVPAT